MPGWRPTRARSVHAGRSAGILDDLDHRHDVLGRAAVARNRQARSCAGSAGFNLLLGPEAQPRAILSALSTITDVKVLSSPSLVVIDNQPAVLEVGDQSPVTTSTATLLSNSNAPVVNTIEMRSTGVILKVLPHVHANGLVQLRSSKRSPTWSIPASKR